MTLAGYEQGSFVRYNGVVYKFVAFNPYTNIGTLKHSWGDAWQPELPTINVSLDTAVEFVSYPMPA